MGSEMCIRDSIPIENQEESQKNEKEEAKAKKIVSFRLCLFLTPLILVADAMVFYCVKYTDFIQDTVWSNAQLRDFFTIFLCPTFVLTMICCFASSHLCEEDSTTDGACKYIPSILLITRFWKQFKKCLLYLSLIVMIAVSVVFGSVVDKLNRTTVAFVSGKNELVILPVISKGKLIGCDSNNTDICPNLMFNISDFRDLLMMAGVAYVQRLPKQNVDLSQIKSTKTNFFDLTATLIWKKDAPDELKNAGAHCKKCLVDSPICNQFLESIQEIGRCDGKLTFLIIFRTIL